jgi:YidC/Oxa1 family membrane protein insertase
MYRSFSASPLVNGGISKVPGSGAKDGWSDDVLQLGPNTSAPSSEVLQGDVLQAVTDATHAGQDLASLGLGALYTPAGLVQNLLDSLQATTGMPWWGAIAVTTVVLRLCLFPLSIKFAKTAAKMAKLQPELAEIMKKIQYYVKIGSTELHQKEQMKVAELYRAHNCSPLQMFTLPFLQVPFFMSFFIGLRKMALAPLESMKSGGMFWFTDLTVPDPTYALPLIACGLFVMNIQLGGEVGETNVLEKRMKKILTAGSVCLIPITISFPTAVFMYWIPNTLLVTLQMLMLKTPAVRTALGIPLIEKRNKPS